MRKRSVFDCVFRQEGLFEMFTPIGKITVSDKIESQTNNRVFRDPSTVDNSFQHSKLKDNLDVTQSYVINTGKLRETMVGLVEEIIYSPKVYLITFKEIYKQVKLLD